MQFLPLLFCAMVAIAMAVTKVSYHKQKQKNSEKNRKVITVADRQKKIAKSTVIHPLFYIGKT